MITSSLISDGCVIEPGARIENSVIGLRCRIGRDVSIRNSILMGADFYESPDSEAASSLARACVRDPATLRREHSTRRS